ncbi:hypothetical protein [uncultured Hymenobacter sp.]|uniref:hypothetical protein n=1 Tax=uncultured Hymenobacter sp. TaxID=170016 RepID=UPI0035CC3E13
MKLSALIPTFLFTAASLLGALAPALAQTKRPTPPATAKPAAPATPPATAPNAAAPKIAPPLRVSDKFVGKLSTDPAQYILDVQTMMVSTNSASARTAAANLRTLWGSNRLTATQQGRIVAISQQLLAKKFRPRPHFEALFTAITGGAGAGPAKLSDQQMDQFLDVLSQSVDQEPVVQTEKFLFGSARLLGSGVLYRSGFNSLKMKGGTISFAYNAAPAESTEEFGAPEPAKPAAPAAKLAAAAAKKPAAKPVAKAAPKKKKASSSGWDTSDLWSSPSGGGWGDNDGWGAPTKKAAPKKAVAKAPAKAAVPAAKASSAPTPPAAAKADDFDQGAFTPTPDAAYDTYVAPPARGAVFVIKDADVQLATAGDSVTLRKVSGTAVPGTNRFIAQGGQLAWTIRQNPVTADLQGFDFDMGKPEFTAQPVTLTYAAVLEAPVKGALSYKATRRKPGAADNSYPRFISLTNDARLKNVGQNISYRGGLSLAGGRLLSAALDGSASRLLVSLAGQPKFKASSRAYVLGDSVITADRAAVTIYQGTKDSITHPGVTLKYLKGKQMLKLAREQGIYKNTPYSDSYHQMDVRTELLTWQLNKPTIDFAMLTAKDQVTADFESKEFFTNTRYQQLKSINHLHPLQMLVGYSRSHDNAKKLNVSTMAEDLKMSEPNLRSAIAGLARDGYVQWTALTGEVLLLPKGLHYVAAARDKKDFDHLAIKSLAGSGRNATLNLDNNVLLVRGVDRFNFSDDSASVFVQPDSGLIRIERNRNIKFSGRVVASSFTFRGREFQFDYDGFFVDMPKLDSVVVRSKVRKPTAPGAPDHSDFALTNRGKQTSGRLYINDPRNKSNRKKAGAYPAFNSASPTTVFFNKSDVLGGAYDTTMHFDIPPFRLDSLNNVARSTAGFEGVFNSGGIMPPIKTKLLMQDDGSLGFTHSVPTAGYPLYGGKGQLTGKVRLDGKGLQAGGSVKYLSGTFASDQFIFYKDSTVTQGKSGVIAGVTTGGVDLPKVNLPASYLMRWAARTDSMFLTTPRSGEPLKLYAGTHNFKGTAVFTPQGLGGEGRFEGPQSFIKSPELSFKTNGYTGKKATLSVKSAEANKPALTANDVAFDYNLQKGYADFTREAGSKASIDLPYSQFKTTLSGGRWDFKKKVVQLRVAAGTDSTTSYFTSVKPEQHGLRFRAAQATYDLAKYQLEARGVPHIASADAWIIPDSGRVSVMAGARIKPLRNSEVLLDSLARFHKLYQGNITVLSRDAFSGDAMYRFKTAASDSVAIRFANFQSGDSTGVGALASVSPTKKRGLLGSRKSAPAAPSGTRGATTAVAAVQPTDNFEVAPHIAYRGDILLNSQRRGLVYNGQAQLQFGKDKYAGDYFVVRDSIDPKAVSINLREPKTEDGGALFTGLYLSDNTNIIYPLYAGVKGSETDLNFLPVDGQLRYDAKTRDYTLSRHDLTDPNKYGGAALTYHDATGRLDFRGPLTFISNNKNFAISGSGVGSGQPDSARYKVDALLAFDISLPQKAVEALVARIGSVTKNSPPALEASANDLYKLGEFAEQRDLEGYASRGGTALSKIAPKLQLHTLVLNKVDLRWNSKLKAWYSVGKLGLAGVGKRDVNAQLDGYVEIKRENNADLVEMYLEVEPQTWYYFKYANGLLLTKSADDDGYNYAISSKAKYDYNTATDYGVFVGDLADVDGFRARFRKEHLGQTGKLPARVEAPAKTEDFGDDAGKKKKRKKGDVFEPETGAAPGAEPAPTAPEPSGSKKKKQRKDDPFGDGVLEVPPTSAPTPPASAKPTEADAPAPKPAQKAEPATPDADPNSGLLESPTPAEPANAPAEDGSKRLRKQKTKQKAADEVPTDEPADQPTEEPVKKRKEKKKKNAADDPFGDS